MKDADELMGLVQQGDSSAFSELFEEFNRELTWFLARRSGLWQTGEDLAQIVWMKVHQSAKLYRPLGQFNGWLLRMAKHTLIDHIRLTKRERESRAVNAPDDDLTSRVPSRDDDFDRMLTEEESQRVEDLLPSIPEDQAMVFSLYVFCGLTLPEIAKQMDSNLPTTKSRFRLAKEKLFEKATNLGYAEEVELPFDRLSVKSFGSICNA